MIETQNAVIRGAHINIERGMLTASISLEFNAGSQCFGGYDLTRGNSASLFIRRVLEIDGVDSWEKLKGRPIRVKGEPWGLLQSIGHFLKDEWFDPAKEFKNVELPNP